VADEPSWDEIFSSAPRDDAGRPAGARPPADDSASRPAVQSRRELREASEAASRGRSRGRGSRSGAKPPGRTRRRWIPLLVSVVVILGLAAGASGYVWANYEEQVRKVLGWELPPPDYAGQGSGETTVIVHAGDNGTEVTKALVDAGVIKNFDTFYTLLLAQDPPVRFFPGYYILAEKMSSQAALAAIQDPKNRVERTALIQEGKTKDQVFDILSAATELPVSDFEAAAKDPTAFGIPAAAPSIEGYLFPATYHFDPGVDARSVLQTLVARTFQSLDAAGVAPEDRLRVLTIASLIQREAGVKKEDFYKVSRVIQNRLASGMKLQFDSTSHYGYAWKHGTRQDGGVFSSKAELTDDNPFNTYVISGLPIGPIGAAGDLAIDAALHPVDGPWKFFVTVNLDTGETVFSETNAQHDAAVRQLREWCRTSQSANCG
jgi:conserved hypothetical protein, YceG family